jgi:hypothetical protein
MEERFNGRVAREVLGITIYQPCRPADPAAGPNRVYNARRQRVLGGVSPDEAVRRRMGSEPSLANKRHEPPPDACILPKALLIVEAAKEAS